MSSDSPQHTPEYKKVVMSSDSPQHTPEYKKVRRALALEVPLDFHAMDWHLGRPLTPMTTSPPEAWAPVANLTSATFCVGTWNMSGWQAAKARALFAEISADALAIQETHLGGQATAIRTWYFARGGWSATSWPPCSGCGAWCLWPLLWPGLCNPAWCCRATGTAGGCCLVVAALCGPAPCSLTGAQGWFSSGIAATVYLCPAADQSAGGGPPQVCGCHGGSYPHPGPSGTGAAARGF